MKQDLAAELAALERLSVAELQARFEELVGEPSRSRNRRHLIRRVSWWTQLRHHREEERWERVRERGLKMARIEDARLTAPKGESRVTKRVPVASRPEPKLPPPGTTLIRPYRGRDIRVTVLADGFEMDGVRGSGS
jgi:hypothetical protein